MSTDTLTGPDWTAMLDQIQQSLARILTEVEERERATNFAAVVTAPAGSLAPPAKTNATDWHRGITAAEEDAAEVENRLTEAQEAICAWLTRTTAVGQALASAGDSGV